MTAILTRPDELEETHLESEIPCGRRPQGRECDRTAEWRMVLDCEICGRVSVPVCVPCLIQVQMLAGRSVRKGEPVQHSWECKSPARYVAAVKL